MRINFNGGRETMKKKFYSVFILMMAGVALLVTGCTTGPVGEDTTQVQEDTTAVDKTVENSGVVNLYTDRHYDTDQELYDAFEVSTGIKVNVVKGKGDELIERLTREDADTEADLLITADAGRLYRAKEADLLQAVSSEILLANVPTTFKDGDDNWYALTMRARVLVYSPDRVSEEDLSTYEALTGTEWKNRILVRSSSNIYNQSLLASFIELNGREQAKEWAAGLVANMAREPQGNDRSQATGVVAGEGDLAIMNTYYIGKMIHSDNPEEAEVGKKVKVFFPNQETTGTHINVSGIGMTKYAKNADNALKLMEFLSSKEAQSKFAEANYEYPIHPDVEVSKLLKSWGDFKAQEIDFSKLGENNMEAVKIFNEVEWK